MQYHWIVGRPIWLAVCCCYATATLLVKPQNASASEGHRVQLNCSTDFKGRPINWRNISVAEGDSEVDIFLNGTFVNGYDNRFQMDVDKAKGVYNLVIPSVQLRDAGTYRCRDKDGAGLYDDAILNVTESTDPHIAPEHAEAQVGDGVQLNCTTYYKTEPVNWQHIPHGKDLPLDVYIGGRFVNDYNTTRYKAQTNNKTGTNNLIITAVKLGDSGLYRCIEQEGRGQHSDAELSVIDTVECYMFPNDLCGTSPVNVSLGCNMTFLGKLAPLIQWVTAKDVVVAQGVATTIHADRVTSILVKEIDNLILTLDDKCQAAISRASCMPNNSANCHTETYDSSTHSYVPDIDSSSTDKKRDLRWLLILFVLIPIAVMAAIYIWHRRKRNQFSTPPEQEDERAENETL